MPSSSKKVAPAVPVRRVSPSSVPPRSKATQAAIHARFEKVVVAAMARQQKQIEVSATAPQVSTKTERPSSYVCNDKASPWPDVPVDKTSVQRVTSITTCTQGNHSHSAASANDIAAPTVVALAATKLNHFHPPEDFFGQPIGSFTKVKWLAKAIYGPVELHRLELSAEEMDAASKETLEIVRELDGDSISGTSETAPVQLPVVVKRIKNIFVDTCRSRESNDRIAHQRDFESKEDPLNEIGIYKELQGNGRRGSPHVLRMLSCFRDGQHTRLVTEFCEGGEIMQMLISGRQLDTASVKRTLLGMLQGTSYIHGCNIGLRDISLENALLKGDVVKLMDFGQCVQLCSASGAALRYHSRCCKEYYRAPEVWLPNKPLESVYSSDFTVEGGPVLVQAQGYLFEAEFPPNAAEGHKYLVEPSGYAVAPIDVFALGVCFFLMHASLPPWKKALMLDAGFAYVKNHGIAHLLSAWQNSLTIRSPPLSGDAVDLMSAMVQISPANRCSLQEALESPWFALEPLATEPELC